MRMMDLTENNQIQKLCFCRPHAPNVKPISGGVDRASGTETMTQVQFPVGLNQRLQKLAFTASLFNVQHLEGTVRIRPSPNLVDRWQFDSKTERSFGCFLTEATW